MSILGHGVDIVSVPRIREVFERQGKHFAERIFSEEEREYCSGKPDPYPHFAARFAAKEAFAKALGLGIGQMGDFLELSVIHNQQGAPSLQLRGRARELFSKLGGKSVFLSISHDGEMAMASVILSGS